MPFTWAKWSVQGLGSGLSSFVPESGVCRSYKSVPFPERLPQISGNGMKDGFEEIEHEFPVGKKQDYLLGCFSLGPGSALGEKGKKIGERSKLTPDNRWDRFAHRCLSCLSRFFPFPPPRPPPLTQGAWSQAGDVSFFPEIFR